MNYKNINKKNHQSRTIYPKKANAEKLLKCSTSTNYDSPATSNHFNAIGDPLKIFSFQVKSLLKDKRDDVTDPAQSGGILVWCAECKFF